MQKSSYFQMYLYFLIGKSIVWDTVTKQINHVGLLTEVPKTSTEYCEIRIIYKITKIFKFTWVPRSTVFTYYIHTVYITGCHIQTNKHIFTFKCPAGHDSVRCTVVCPLLTLGSYNFLALSMLPLPFFLGGRLRVLSSTIHSFSNITWAGHLAGIKTCSNKINA